VQGPPATVLVALAVVHPPRLLNPIVRWATVLDREGVAARLLGEYIADHEFAGGYEHCRSNVHGAVERKSFNRTRHRVGYCAHRGRLAVGRCQHLTDDGSRQGPSSVLVAKRVGFTDVVDKVSTSSKSGREVVRSLYAGGI
jgi:hypothetical protein